MAEFHQAASPPAPEPSVPQEQSLFSVVPTEVIAEIYEWVNDWGWTIRARRVSKKWASALALVLENGLSRDPELTREGIWRPERKRLGWYRQLFLNLQNLSEGFLESFRFIDLSMIPLASDSDAKLIATGFPRIQKLSLRGTKSVTNASLSAVAANCTDLREVDVSECRSRITDESFRQMAYKSTLLENVNIHGTNGAITDTSICLLARNNLNLRLLNVGSTWGKVSDSSCYELARFSAQLAVLDVSDTRGAITDDGLIAVAKGCPNLHSLSVGGTGGKVTDRLFEALADLHRNMTLIDVSDTSGKVTDKGLTALLPWCTNLKVFRARNISNNSIGQLALTALGKSCSLLEELDLFQLDSKCKSVEANGLKAVGEGCPSLRVVDLTRCLNVELGLRALLQNGNELRVLTLRGEFPHVDGSAVAPLLMKANLEVLNLAGTRVLMSELEKLIKVQLKTLKRLRLGPYFVTDTRDDVRHILQVISENPNCLEEIDLGAARGSVPLDLLASSEFLGSLRRLIVPRWYGTDGKQEGFQRRYPNCTITFDNQ
jgi:hypothetical protein